VEKKFLDISLLKFLAVGVLNTAFGAAVMFLLYNLAGCTYWVSSAANYILGSFLSYFLNKYFTFQNKERSWKIAAKFAANILVCYLLAYGVAKPLTLRLLTNRPQKLQENAAMLVGMVLFTALNYFGQRYFAFRKKGESA
jgi:putative flippase GtrA